MAKFLIFSGEKRRNYRNYEYLYSERNSKSMEDNLMEGLEPFY